MRPECGSAVNATPGARSCRGRGFGAAGLGRHTRCGDHGGHHAHPKARTGVNPAQPASNASPQVVGVTLVLGSMVLQESGAALATTMFGATGAVGMVALRVCLSAVLLWAIARPRVRGLDRASWLLAARYGLVLTGMNLAFYLALDRLYLGTTVTIEVLGPLALSVIARRTWLNAVWAATALVGVLLLAQGHHAAIDPVGVIFALASAALWAAYIMATKRTGERFDKLAGMTIGMAIGGIAVAPLAAITAGAALIQPSILLAGLGVAILSSAGPYSLEMLALRRLPASTFAILLALAPAVAALAGLALLGQVLSAVAWFGVALVVIASIGATTVRRR